MNQFLRLQEATLLIAEGNSLEAINRLLAEKEKLEKEIYHHLIEVKARYNYFDKSKISGLLDYKEQALEIASINNSLLKIIDKIEIFEEDLKNKASNKLGDITVNKNQQTYTNSPAERIVLLKNILNLNRAGMAKELGVAQGYLSQVLNEQRGLSYHMVEKLSSIYRVNANWLLTGEGEMFLNK